MYKQTRGALLPIFLSLFFILSSIREGRRSEEEEEEEEEDLYTRSGGSLS